MALDAARLKRMTTVAATVGAFLVFALGIAAFAIALRPCRISLAPGEVATWRLTTTIGELLPDGRKGATTSTTCTVVLIGTGPDNEGVLLAPGDDGAMAATPIRYRADGAACALDADLRPLPEGRAVGFFDFNLLPVPASGDLRETGIDYARLPPDHNPVSGKVRRTRSGPRPEFRFTLQKSVEWVDHARYQQIVDLVATYTFNAGWGLVEHAQISLVAGIERENAARYQVELNLVPAHSPRHHRSATAQVRDAAMALCAAQEVLAARRREGYGAAAARLEAADRALAETGVEVAELHDASLATVAMLHGGAKAASWALCLAHGPQSQRAQAVTLQQQVAAAGYPSGLATLPGGDLAVLLGPYADPDPLLAATIARRFPGFTPAWIEAPK
jgi:hypothetical protein